MSWAWRIAKIRGIEIKVHITFIFALIWGALLWGQGGPAGWLYGALLTLILFGVVLLHELGHALAAQRYKIAVQDIVLLPIGGVARLSRMPDNPRQELVVALAGPAVNLGLILLLTPLLLIGLALQAVISGAFALPALVQPGVLNLAAFLWVINISLLLFNMLPAFPMDGGRVLRAGLALRLPYGRATDIAAVVGRSFAVLFAAFGLLNGNLFLALIGLFVFFSAGAERQEVAARESLRGLTVTEVIDNQAPVLPASLPAHLGFDRLLRSPYQALAVVDDAGRLLGVITRQGMQQRWIAGERGAVAGFVEPPVLAVQCLTPLEVARQNMAESQAQVAAVFCGSSFEGLLDFETISRVVALRQLGWRLAGPNNITP